MNKQELIEEARKLVIMGCHPGMNYEDSLRIENTMLESKTLDLMNLLDSYSNLDMCWEDLRDVLNGDNKGLPITIGRVIAALKNYKYAPSPMSWLTYNFDVCLESIVVCEWINSKPSLCDEFFIYWQLLKKDGTEATMEDQTIDTIKAIIKLLKTNK